MDGADRRGGCGAGMESAATRTRRSALAVCRLAFPVPAAGGCLLPSRGYADIAAGLRLGQTSLAFAWRSCSFVSLGRCQPRELVSRAGDDCHCNLLIGTTGFIL